MKFLANFILVFTALFSQYVLASDLHSQRNKHLAYLSLLQHLESRGFNQTGTLELVSRKMHLDDSNAQKLLDFAGNSYYQMLDNTRLVSRELLCPKQLNLKFVSENARMLVTTIKDIEDSHLYTAYSSVLTNFDKNTFNTLNVWLEDWKPKNQASVSLGIDDYIGVCGQYAFTSR